MLPMCLAVMPAVNNWRYSGSHGVIKHFYVHSHKILLSRQPLQNQLFPTERPVVYYLCALAINGHTMSVTINWGIWATA